MDKFQAMQVFATIVDQGSLTAAAQAPPMSNVRDIMMRWALSPPPACRAVTRCQPPKASAGFCQVTAGSRTIDT